MKSLVGREPHASVLFRCGPTVVIPRKARNLLKVAFGSGEWRANRRFLAMINHYFDWIPSTYATKFVILCCTWASCPWLMLENRGPQIGISASP